VPAATGTCAILKGPMDAMIIRRTNTILYCSRWAATVAFYRDHLSFIVDAVYEALAMTDVFWDDDEDEDAPTIH